jgi:hypothetical protein
MDSRSEAALANDAGPDYGDGASASLQGIWSKLADGSYSA